MSSTGNKGDGGLTFGDSFKSQTSFGFMDCDHCTPDVLNVFTCFEIHGRITKECLRIHRELMT
jgi:hypothetical protein